jgi:CARDB
MRAVGIGLLAASLAAAATAATASRPDLTVTHVSLSKRVIFVGGSFRAYDTTKNRGRAAAGLTVTRYALVPADSTLRVNVGSARASRSIRSLAPGASSRGSRLIQTAKSFKPGAYRVKVCADANRAIRETSEKNNCRLSPQILLRKPPLPV